MDGRESVRMAWRSIRSHRLRSTLTTLGVVIGVGAVITFVTLGASLEGAIIGEVAAEQSPVVTVTSQPATGGGGPGFGGEQPVFTTHDVATVGRLEGVASVVPLGSVSLAGITYQGRSLALPSMTATTPAYFTIAGQGNFTSGGPFDAGEREVVLNEQAATLFAQNVSVGDRMTVRTSSGDATNATVVGILASGESASPFGQFVAPRVYGPVDPFYGTAIERPSTGERVTAYSQVLVVATGFDQVEAVADRIETALVDSDASTLLPASYRTIVRTNERIVQQIREILNTFTGFITGIAVISLIVGAIGIANIMLVSVTERTREIGIMKAVGFQNRDVLQLFLVEATMLGLIGSVVGIAVGVLAGYAATEVIDLPFIMPWSWPVIAVGVGIVVGVVAGLYPAWNGARIDPIEALRYE